MEQLLPYLPLIFSSLSIILGLCFAITAVCKWEEDHQGPKNRTFFLILLTIGFLAVGMISLIINLSHSPIGIVPTKNGQQAAGK